MTLDWTAEVVGRMHMAAITGKQLADEAGLTNSYTKEENKMKYNSVEEWKAEATRRFGPDMLKWRFRCPMCGHVASVQDFKDAGAKSPSCAYQECLGRYTGKGTPKKGDSSGCNWAAYGLFGIPAEHDIVVVAPGDQVDVYPFADGEQEADNG